MALAQRLYELRKQHSLSQEQLAEQLGVSRQAISKWESGQSVPEGDKLIAISDYFQISLDYLMKDGTPSETNAAAVKAAKNVSERRTLGLIVCIGGIVGLLLWGLLFVLAPSTSSDLAGSSMITLGGNGILIVLCLFAIVSGTFLILKGAKKHD